MTFADPNRPARGAVAQPAHDAPTPSGAPGCAGRVRIGLLGMYASANLGDTAVQRSVMGALHARRPDIEFVGLCTDPEDAARTFRMPAFASSGLGGKFVPLPDGTAVLKRLPRELERLPLPLRAGIAAVRIDRQMRALDMLLVSGSGQLQDHWGGAWGQPLRLLAWCAFTRRQRKPAAVFGVGLDTMHTRLGVALCVRALRLATLRVVRDAGSLEGLRAAGLRSETAVCPDPAFGLRVPAAVAQAAAARHSELVVISPISRLAWPGIDEAQHDRYLDTLAAAADRLQRAGMTVRFVCSQWRMDPATVVRVRERMRTDASRTQWLDVRTVDDYLLAVAPARLVVASRLHALILAMVAGAPVLGITAVRKVMQQLRDAGVPGQALDVRTLDAPQLLARIDASLADADRLRAHLAVTTARMRDEVDAQFERLAALVPDRPGASAAGMCVTRRG